MKREDLYERRQAASRMEAVMLIVTAVCLLAAVFGLLRYGLLAGLAFSVLGALAFGLSRVFDLLGDLFALNCKPEHALPARDVQGTATKG
jgi:hypothetical protein